MERATGNMKPPHTPPRVAIVHDWLVGGGAELVVEQLHTLFPAAPIYTSYATRQWRERLDNVVVTGWLQHLGWARKWIPLLRIWWFTHLKFTEYDIVISSSGAEAKGIRVPKNTLHISYCHAPTHYYWSRYAQYMHNPGLGVLNPLARIGLWVLVRPLRQWDLRAAQRPHVMLANSLHIQQEIAKYYQRDSVVVHPPVYFERFQKPKNQKLRRRGYVISGRQTPYKRFDLAIAACTKLGLPLTVIGTGPDHSRLRKLAGKSITFLGAVSDEVLEKEFASAEALLFPGLDDFGITPVEAMAAGTPVLAFRGGGALDYVHPGQTGEFFDQPTALSLAQALKTFNPAKYHHETVRAVAERYSARAFRVAVKTELRRAWKNFLKEAR